MDGIVMELNMQGLQSTREQDLTEQFQRLLDCLNEQKELYLKICDVLNTEKKYLILADIKSLVENNKLKEALLAKSRALEKIRPLRVSELLKVLQKEPKDISVSALIPMLSKELAKKLIEIQGGLNQVLSDLK